MFPDSNHQLKALYKCVFCGHYLIVVFLDFLSDVSSDQLRWWYSATLESPSSEFSNSCNGWWLVFTEERGKYTEVGKCVEERKFEESMLIMTRIQGFWWWLGTTVLCIKYFQIPWASLWNSVAHSNNATSYLLSKYRTFKLFKVQKRLCQCLRLRIDIMQIHQFRHFSSPWSWQSL